MAGAYTREDIKRKFKTLDRNGDGKLSFGELQDLLMQGNPDMTDRDIELLWESLDHDGDGAIDFDEFVDFIFKATATDDKPDWNGAKVVFLRLAGRDERLDAREFVRMCHDCDLFDDMNYGVTDADIMYKKIAVIGERGIGFAQFKKLVKLVAKKKTMPLQSCVAWIAALNEDGPDARAASRAGGARAAVADGDGGGRGRMAVRGPAGGSMAVRGPAGGGNTVRGPAGAGARRR